VSTTAMEPPSRAYWSNERSYPFGRRPDLDLEEGIPKHCILEVVITETESEDISLEADGSPKATLEATGAPPGLVSSRL